MADDEREQLMRLADNMRRTLEEAPQMPTDARLDYLWTRCGDWYSAVANILAAS